MLDLNNDFVLSACIGFIAVVISYIYNKDKGNKEQSKNSNSYYFYVFLVVSLLVYGGLYFKNKNIDNVQKGGSDTSIYSGDVSINDPNF